MKTEIIKSFSSFGCDAQLARISFEQSCQVVFQVSVRYLIVPKGWSSNFKVHNFGEDKHSAKECFRKYLADFI